MCNEQIRLKMFGEMCVFTGMGLGSKDTTTPAISVILCNPKKSMSYQPKKKNQCKNFAGFQRLKKCKKKMMESKFSSEIHVFRFCTFVFSVYLKNVACHPDMIPCGDANDRANLELPLLTKSHIKRMISSWTKCREKKWHRNARCAEFRSVFYLPRHDFCVDPADVDAGKQAGLVVGINDVAPVRFIGSRRTVVRTLSHHFRCSRFSAEDVNHFHYVLKKID